MSKVVRKVLVILCLIVSIVICAFIYEKYKPQETIPTFANYNWMRIVDDEIEYINFDSENHFSYYTSDGNAVMDYDLCDRYHYYENNNFIELECESEGKQNVFTDIKVVSYENDVLKLKFGNEVKEFTLDITVDDLVTKG